jgi:hypothetical protein
VVKIKYSNSSAIAALNLPADWRVKPTDDLMKILNELLGGNRAGMCYT